MRLIDTHVHLWDPAEAAPAWLERAPLPKKVGLLDYADATADVEVEAFVFVEADVRPGLHLKEAAWVQRLAEAEPRLRGVVAHAPLERGEGVRGDLEALKRLPLVKGVRRLLQGEADPAFCLREGFVAGVRLLPTFGLHFEVCIYHHQLGPAIDLVRRCPEVAFVLDHIAKPGIRDGLDQPWRDEMRALAALPNVTCKLSGVATEADHASWTEAELRPYIDHALAVFGPKRTMFGSDWPVSTLAIGYRRWVEVVLRAIGDLGPEDQGRILRDTARTTYRLEDSP